MIRNNTDPYVVNQDHSTTSSSQVKLYYFEINLMNISAVIFYNSLYSVFTNPKQIIPFIKYIHSNQNKSYFKKGGTDHYVQMEN